MVPDWLAPDLGNGFGLNRIVNDLGGTLAPVDRQRTGFTIIVKMPGDAIRTSVAVDSEFA